jgi:hypothetical protein
MKKTILTGLLMLGTSTLLANTLTLTWGAVHSPSGGEFILTPNGGGPFLSFCIERSEHVVLGGTYNYVENYQAVLGGLGGPHPDPISIGTAWLYSQFRAGTLGSYDSSSAANQTDLQNAFWWLEQEIGAGVDINGQQELAYDPTTNLYLSEALTALGRTLDGLQADANGAYNVGVYNLYNLDGSVAQDQLALVPDGGSTLVMLGLGLTGFAFVSRKIRK